MSEVKIRPTIPADLDALADVLVRVHATDGYPVEGVDDPRSWVDLPEAVGQWTALLEGRPVGHAALMRPAREDRAAELLVERDRTAPAGIAVLARLFVAPKVRGSGVAQRLVEVVHGAASSNGQRLVLEVMGKDAAAIRLYKRNGWQSLGVFHHQTPAGDVHEAEAFVAPN